jgi:hypothetical protein
MGRRRRRLKPIPPDDPDPGRRLKRKSKKVIQLKGVRSNSYCESDVVR